MTKNIKKVDLLGIDELNMKEHVEFLNRFFEKLFGKGVSAENIVRRTIYIRLIKKGHAKEVGFRGLGVSEVIFDKDEKSLKIALELSNGLIIHFVESALKEKDGSTYGQIHNPPRSLKLVDVLYGNVQVLVL